MILTVEIDKTLRKVFIHDMKIGIFVQQTIKLQFITFINGYRNQGDLRLVQFEYFLIWSTANLLQCNSYITMKINWVLHMETIHAPPATVRIRNRTTLITVEILALPPSRTDIVFNSRTTQRRKLLVSVNVEFDFTFSPPSGLVCLIGKDTHANSQKRPLPDSWGRTV